MKGKILVNTTDLSLGGGVSQYLKNLNLNANEKIEYFNIQSSETSLFKRIFKLISIYIAFNKKINFFSIVNLNPSLNSKSFYRDLIFILIARFKKKKIIITMHGWEDQFEKKIKNSRILKFIFSKTYAKVPFYIVLGEHFKNKLLLLDVDAKTKFYIETTVISDVDNDWSIKERSLGSTTNFLFMSRIEKEKGVYIAIDTIEKLSKEHECKLFIAGIGTELEGVKNYIKFKNIKNVNVMGFVSGKKKQATFKNNDILLFPTYYGEGLPTVILEAMLHGLPIISRVNAAIPEIIKNDFNGYLTESTSTDDFVLLCKKLIESPKLYSKISGNNRRVAIEKFVAKEARKRILSIYNEVQEYVV